MISNELIQQLTKDLYIFKGILTQALSEKENVQKSVESSKNWLLNQPVYLKFLQNLQSILHQRNLGVFSQLLTYFVKDVLGKDKDIIFDLYTFRNLPALKIEALNDGCREDIYEGNGGSIANIVSTGLRLIVLSRLSNRKFIILDEPDCWLKPEHVPSFAKIIGELSEKLKIQTVIISHHDWNYFKDYGRVVRLFKDGNHLESEIIHESNLTEIAEEDFIKSIRLRNFMSHADTDFNLHPYLTCLVGENDIGKSVLSTAIKSVVFGESSDTYIKHHTNEAQVLITLSNNTSILWQRFKSTSQDNPQKVKYSIYRSNDLISAEYSSQICPLNVEKILNICKVDDIDVHIGSQKQPVFLLSNEVKANDRAKILSLGKESILITKMMENIKSKAKIHNSIIKDGEQKFLNITKTEEALSNLEELLLRSVSLSEKFNYLSQLKSEIINLNDMVLKLDSLKDFVESNNIKTVKSDKPLNNTGELDELSKNLTILKLISNIFNLKHLNGINIDYQAHNNLIKLVSRLVMTSEGSSLGDIKTISPITLGFDNINLENLIDSIGVCKSLLDVQKLSNKNTNIQMVDSKEIAKDIIYLENLYGNYKLLESNLVNIKSELENANQDLTVFINEYKYCPTCNQPLSAKDYIID